MSFYGQVLYEFTKLFSRINFKNSDSEDALDVQETVSSLEPKDKWDSLNFKGGNRWIQLTTDPSNNTITFSHSTPGEKVDDRKNVIGFAQIKEDDIPANAKITDINYGDCIQTTTSTYDEAGHSLGAQMSYFRMPKGETVEHVEELQENMKYVFDNFLTCTEDDTKGQYIEDYLTEKEYVKVDTLEDSMEEYLLSNNYVTTELTGDLSNMNTTNNTSEWTITETIGDMNSSNEDSVKSALDTILEVPTANRAETSYSVSNAIIELIGLISKQQGSIDSLLAANIGISALNAKITELENRIEILEAYHHETPTE